MSKFVYVHETSSTLQDASKKSPDTEDLNAILTDLQKKGANILGVSLTTVNASLGVGRIYVILYEAKEPY